MGSRRDMTVMVLREGLRPEAFVSLDEVIDCFATDEELGRYIASVIPITRRILDDNDFLVPASEVVSALVEFVNRYSDDLTMVYRKARDTEAEVLSCLAAFFIVTHKHLVTPSVKIIEVNFRGQ